MCNDVFISVWWAFVYVSKEFFCVQWAFVCMCNGVLFVCNRLFNFFAMRFYLCAMSFCICVQWGWHLGLHSASELGFNGFNLKPQLTFPSNWTALNLVSISTSSTFNIAIISFYRANPNSQREKCIFLLDFDYQDVQMKNIGIDLGCRIDRGLK